jgi:hypothetical protein
MTESKCSTNSGRACSVLHWLFGIAGLLAALSRAAPVSAQEQSERLPSPRHRLSGSLGIAGLGIPGIGVDSRNQGGVGILFRLEYGFRVVRGLEVGADVGYWAVSLDQGPLHTLVPAVVVSPYIPIGDGDSIEVGLHLHAGASLSWMDVAPGTWMGFAVGGGPYGRFWKVSGIAFQVGGDVLTASVKNSEELHGGPQFLYLDNDGRIFGLAWWVGIVGGL